MTHPRPASLARRAFPALAVLGASGALLTQLGGAEQAGAGLLVTDAAGTGAAAAPSTQPPATVPSTSVPRGRTERGAPTAPPAASGATGAVPSTTVPRPPTGGTPTTPTTPTTPAPGGTAAACTGTATTGASVSTRFGPVQVAAVIGANGALCDVQVIAYPDGDRKSLSINQRALPVLRTQAVSSNGETISGLTGATVTTNAYRTSLQSALDRAR